LPYSNSRPRTVGKNAGWEGKQKNFNGAGGPKKWVGVKEFVELPNQKKRPGRVF